MEQVVSSDFKLGIIAGGQLAKMLVLAASNWDVTTYVMDTDEQCPASAACSQFVKGNLKNYDDVLRFGQMVDMITFEIEDINIEALQKLKSQGIRINPDPDILEMIQDKGKQKLFYRDNDIPTSHFDLYEGKQQILRAITDGKLKIPFVQKLRKGGYDGRGVAIIKRHDQLNQMLDGPSLIEDLVPVSKEVSVIAARNEQGEVRCFPLVEMEFNESANLVERLVCPASVDDQKSREAERLATKIVSALELQGIIAVEFFLDHDNNILVNEMAPRPHNSGHHTIESNITSQFEQHLRTIFDFPLGSTEIKLPAVMINLLGEAGYEGLAKYEGLSESLEVEGVKVHLYGKKITRPFRKMGHVTVMDHSIENAKTKADIVKKLLKIKS